MYHVTYDFQYVTNHILDNRKSLAHCNFSWMSFLTDTFTFSTHAEDVKFSTFLEDTRIYEVLDREKIKS